MKKSFTLLEVILTLLLLAFLYTLFLPKVNENKNFTELKNKIILQLKHLRYKSLVDNQFKKDEDLWHKKFWTFKFFRCKESIGGFYYVIYSDKNKKGHPNQNESLKDPLSNKYIYSSNSCQENDLNSKYVLLSKNYNIKDIKISCNQTSSLGQLSFDSKSKIYSKLPSDIEELKNFEINKPCILEFTDKNFNKMLITIENETGYIY